MNAICSTFDDSDKPEICSKWDICAKASDNESDFTLWGDDQYCAEYRAPFLSNHGKEFDDDYLNFDIDDKTTISPELKNNVDTIPSTETETKSSLIADEDSNTKDDPTNPFVDAILEVDTDTKRPVDLNNSIPTIHEEEIPNPPLLSDPLYISPTNGSIFLNTADTNNVKDKNERMYSHDGQQEFLETIQIYEGSNSDLAIGLGIGFGSAFLLMVIYLLLSRDRERQRMEDLLVSGRIPAMRPRSGSRQRYYAHCRNHSRTPKENPDEFSDEDDHFNDDEGEVEDCHDSHYRHSTRSRERDRLFPRNSKPKSRTRRQRRFLEHVPRDNRSVSNEQEEIKEIPWYANERASSIRKQINDDDFDDDYDVDNDRNRRKFYGECDDDNDNNYDDVDRYISESHR